MTSIEASRIARDLGLKGYDSRIENVTAAAIEKRVVAHLPELTLSWERYEQARAVLSSLPTAN